MQCQASGSDEICRCQLATQVCLLTSLAEGGQSAALLLGVPHGVRVSITILHAMSYHAQRHDAPVSQTASLLAWHVLARVHVTGLPSCLLCTPSSHTDLSLHYRLVMSKLIPFLLSHLSGPSHAGAWLIRPRLDGRAGIVDGRHERRDCSALPADIAQLASPAVCYAATNQSSLAAPHRLQGCTAAHADWSLPQIMSQLGRNSRGYVSPTRVMVSDGTRVSVRAETSRTCAARVLTWHLTGRLMLRGG